MERKITIATQPAQYSPLTTVPTRALVHLVAEAIDRLWVQYVKQGLGCCPRDCCAGCSALSELYGSGQLDTLYGIYMDEVGANPQTWDDKLRQVRRDWLMAAWAPTGHQCPEETTADETQ